jgi:hypothetical protein
MAALFEPDIRQVPERIRQAEKLMIAREREIFSHADKGSVERTALNRAFHALRALQYALRALQFCLKNEH